MLFTCPKCNKPFDLDPKAVNETRSFSCPHCQAHFDFGAPAPQQEVQKEEPVVEKPVMKEPVSAATPPQTDVPVVEEPSYNVPPQVPPQTYPQPPVQIYPQATEASAPAPKKLNSAKWIFLGILLGVGLGALVVFALTRPNRKSYSDSMQKQAMADEVNYSDNDTEFNTEEFESAQEEVTPSVRNFTACGVSFSMTHVEGGSYTMGDDNNPNERPAHRVSVSSFYIGETEVTQELWQAVMNNNPSHFYGNQRPVEMISWNDCQTFIRKLNNITGQQFRMPTEEEWEYAAHGGNRSNAYWYSGSDNVNNVSWYSSNSGGETHNVKSLQPNELGLYDMSGNVFELTADFWHLYLDSTIQSDSRVYRGGSWFHDASHSLITYRYYTTPDYRCSRMGLRLALTP